MNIRFHYEKKQVLDALRNHFFSRMEIRLLVIVINVFAFVSAGLFYFKLIQPVSFLMFSVLWFLLWFTIRQLLPAGIYRRSKTFHENFEAEIGGDGLQLHTPQGSQFWEWQRFSDFRETLYFFHLYFDSRSFFLLPKDAFKDITDTQWARDLFKSKILHSATGEGTQ